MAGDCRRRPGMVRDGGGLPERPGTARVMSHDEKRICLVYDLNLASTGGPSGPRLPGRSPS